MRLPIPLDSYPSSRVAASAQRTVNMYPHSQKGWRQFPGLTEFARVAVGLTYNADDESVAANTSMPATRGSVFMKPDGTEMYVVDGNDAVDQYTLSTPYLLSSKSYTGTKTLTGTGTVTNAIILGFKSDGTELIWAAQDGSSNYYVYRWTLSSGWDITTASATSSFAFPVAIEAGGLNSAGTKLYTQNSGRAIRTYTMTAYDVTTLSATGDVSVSLSVATGSLAITSAEDTIYGTSSNGGILLTIEMPTPGDVTSITSSQTLFESAVGQVGCHIANGSDTLIITGDEESNEVITFTIGLSSGAGRGAINMGGVLYAVIAQTLYSVSSAGGTTTIGTIAGTERVVMETDGTQLVITTGTDGGTIYVYTVASGLTTVTDPQVEDTANSSAYLDLAFYLDQADGKFIASANNDATSYSADDIAEAESFADDTLRTYGHNQLLYICGETSMEAWFTSGVGRPPVDRQQVIERGIIGTHAISSIDDTIFFVDQFTRPNAMSGLEYRPIYTPGIAEEWATYTTVSDCIVTAYSYNQQNFVDFIFPTQGVSWTYHVDSGQWSEREDTSNGQSRIIEYVNVYGKLLGLDRSTAQVFELSETDYQDDGSNITRVKDTAIISADIYGEPVVFGDEMICNSLKITTESTGAATLTVSLAKDGNTFAQSRTMTLTAGRQTRELNAWGKFREGIFRITTTSNAGVDIVDIAADLEPLRG